MRGKVEQNNYPIDIRLNSRGVNRDFEPRFCGTFVLVADTTRKTYETAKPFRGFSPRPSIKKEGT